MNSSTRNAVTIREQAQNAAFTTTAAKIALVQRGQTVSGLARKFNLARNTVSMAINRGAFPRVRALIAQELQLS